MGGLKRHILSLIHEFDLMPTKIVETLSTYGNWLNSSFFTSSQLQNQHNRSQFPTGEHIFSLCKLS